jgi:hypothetical protein
LAIRLALKNSYDDQRSSYRIGIVAAFTVLAALSTAFVGALINSNLATVFASACIAVVVASGLVPGNIKRHRILIATIWVAAGAHFYAESVFYSGLILSLIALPTIIHDVARRDFKTAARTILINSTVFLVATNFIALQALASFSLFRQISQSGNWYAWYLHQPEWVWLGSYLSGVVVGGGEPSNKTAVVLLGAAATGVAIVTGLLRSCWRVILALGVTSILAVIYIELRAYQYGEHKIIHLLGGAWIIVLVFAISQLIDARGRTGLAVSAADYLRVSCGIVLIGTTIYLNAGVIQKSLTILNVSRGTHSLGFGLPSLVSYIKPGDSVLLDDSPWIRTEKFLKSHYLSFYVHDQGARLVLPKIGSDIHRGGYFRNVQNDTLQHSKVINWLVVGKGHVVGNSILNDSRSSPVFENEDYRLFRVEDVPVAVAGNGWHECQSQHCWTRGPFEIEVFAPSGGDNYEIALDLAFFNPPTPAGLKISVNGRVVSESLARDGIMRVGIPSGWSRVKIEGTWEAISPQSNGASADDRKLFAMIKDVKFLQLSEKSAEKFNLDMHPIE